MLSDEFVTTRVNARAFLEAEREAELLRRAHERGGDRRREARKARRGHHPEAAAGTWRERLGAFAHAGR